MPATEFEIEQGLKNLKTRSIVRPAEQMRWELREGLFHGLLERLEQLAHEQLGFGTRLTARDLVGSDMPNLANNDWLETTEGSNAYANAAFATGSAIADETFIGIYGFKQIMQEDADADRGGSHLAVATIRFDIGGTRVAQWDMHSTFTATAIAGNAVNSFGGAMEHSVAIAESPVIVTQNQNLTVSFWEVATTLDFTVALLGIVVEKAGRTINP